MTKITNKKTIIFDIDGTLADIEHRRPLLDGDRPNWKQFNAEMGQDTINPGVVELYKSLWEINKYNIVLATGRTEDFRKITENWLIWNEIPFSNIYMRKSGDFRSDDIVKQEILDKLLAKGHEIAFTVDDRQQVVDMWRRNGITCLQCDVGDF